MCFDEICTNACIESRLLDLENFEILNPAYESAGEVIRSKAERLRIFIQDLIRKVTTFIRRIIARAKKFLIEQKAKHAMQLRM